MTKWHLGRLALASAAALVALTSVAEAQWVFLARKAAQRIHHMSVESQQANGPRHDFATVLLEAPADRVYATVVEMVGKNQQVMVLMKDPGNRRLQIAEGDRVATLNVVTFGPDVSQLMVAGTAGPGELRRHRVFATKTWNPPALAGDLLLVRNDLEAALLAPVDEALADEDDFEDGADEVADDTEEVDVATDDDEDDATEEVDPASVEERSEGHRDDIRVLVVVRGPLHVDQCADSREQLEEVEGCAHHLTGAGIQALQSEVGCLRAGQQEDRREARIPPRSHPAAHVECRAVALLRCQHEVGIGGVGRDAVGWVRCDAAEVTQRPSVRRSHGPVRRRR